MKPLLLAVFVSFLSLTSAAVLHNCPRLCKCEFENNSLKAKCNSQKFLQKLDDKQAGQFEILDLSNSTIKTLDKRLKKLKNLVHLDLSNNELKNIQFFPNLPKLRNLSLANNQLKNISFSLLPKEIKDLDISSNFLTDLPKDWSSLHHLSSIHIYNNPVNCDDSSINRYVNLISMKVNIVENVLCYSPKNLNGKNLQSVIADALLNPMLGDQEPTTEDEEEVENEFIKHTTENSEKSNNAFAENLFEGSGSEEGSGDTDKIIIPSACIIDCTTFKPLEILKDNNSSPLLAIKEHVGILFEDLFGKEQDETTTTTKPTDSSSTPVEEVISKKTVTLPMSDPKTTKKTEKLIISKENDNNLERASLDNKEDGYTYYLVATVIILMIVVLIFIILKKKSSQRKLHRKRNSLAENGICEEMKPLGKYKEITNGTNNEKQSHDDLRPERIPLMNGDNHKNGQASQKGSLEDLDVTLRSPSENDHSSPRPERVTVTSGEIPPSVLKTPQLVHRELNSEGEIVTKPLDNSY
ncbi:hypothetical protein HHI36_023190 [Cryptolaemus montrouzieri]|uniref:Uncharacterized protein n=1 Tax=Cryptolaemus montrouzieri TaxID=559131 RepID=A0ABD2PFL2_9CUCU